MAKNFANSNDNLALMNVKIGRSCDIKNRSLAIHMRNIYNWYIYVHRYVIICRDRCEKEVY